MRNLSGASDATATSSGPSHCMSCPKKSRTGTQNQNVRIARARVSRLHKSRTKKTTVTIKRRTTMGTILNPQLLNLGTTKETNATVANIKLSSEIKVELVSAERRFTQ